MQYVPLRSNRGWFALFAGFNIEYPIACIRYQILDTNSGCWCAVGVSRGLFAPFAGAEY